VARKAEIHWKVLPNACAGDHAAVANQHHIGEAESLAQLIDLGGDGFGIGSIASKNFNGDRASGGVGEEAKNDLQCTGLVVSRMTEFGERTVAPFEVSGGQIIEHQATLGEMAFGQGLLDARLLREEPVHRLVKLDFIGGVQVEDLTETVVEGIAVKATSGSEFGSGLDDAGNDHGDDEIALSAWSGIEDVIQVKVTQTTQDGGNMAMRQGAGDVEGVRQRGRGGSQRAGQGQA
jgi:hypothetical protein